MKRCSICIVLLLFFFLSSCSLTSPKTYFCISSDRARINAGGELKKMYFLSMENIENAVIYLNNKKQARRFGRINMSQFLNLYDINDRFDQVPITVTFSFVDPKSNTIQQFTCLALTPEYDRYKKVLIWQLIPTKKAIPLGIFSQNVLVLSLDITKATYLFDNSYLYD